MMRSSRFAIGLTLSVSALGCAKEQQAAEPRIETRDVTYNVGGHEYKGFMAWNAADSGKRPGVVVVHEWWGLNEHTRAQARRLAEAGYVGFAVDMFGEGKTTTHPKDAGTFAAAATKDPAEVVARFNAGIEMLKQDPHVDPERIGAIGHCFGGMVVLSMARAGADLDAVASFHGALPQGKVDSGTVKTHVLVATGGADGFVPQTAVDAFRKEMEAAGAPLHVIVYPNAKHGFTNPNAASYGMEQLAYDAGADTASWRAMTDLFKQVWP